LLVIVWNENLGWSAKGGGGGSTTITRKCGWLLHGTTWKLFRATVGVLTCSSSYEYWLQLGRHRPNGSSGLKRGGDGISTITTRTVIVSFSFRDGCLVGRLLLLLPKISLYIILDASSQNALTFGFWVRCCCCCSRFLRRMGLLLRNNARRLSFRNRLMLEDERRITRNGMMIATLSVRNRRGCLGDGKARFLLRRAAAAGDDSVRFHDSFCVCSRSVTAMLRGFCLMCAVSLCSLFACALLL